jgi:hypothetical protein
VPVTIRPVHRLARVAVVGIAFVTIAVVTIAGCSSSSGSKRSGPVERTSTSTSTASSSTTVPPASAPCTVAALSAVLPSGTRAIGVVCSRGWAAGPDTNGSFDAAYLARADGTTWRVLSASELQQACAAGNSLRVPDDVLAQSPCNVS